MDRAPRLTRELMTPAPYTFGPEVPISDAAGRLLREHHSGAPVVDGEGTLLGVLSELDLIDAMNTLRVGRLPTGKVGDIMSANPVVVTPETSVYELADVFLKGTIRRMPVVEDGHLVGLVSRHDVLRGLRKIEGECACSVADRVPFRP